MPQNSWSTLVLIALMVVAFYFLIMRPQKKRQQAVAQTQRELQPGTKVLLGSGLFGTITAIGDKQAVLEIAPGVELTVLRQAIARVATAADEDSTGTELETDDDAVDEPAQVDSPTYTDRPVGGPTYTDRPVGGPTYTDRPVEQVFTDQPVEPKRDAAS